MQSDEPNVPIYTPTEPVSVPDAVQQIRNSEMVEEMNAGPEPAENPLDAAIDAIIIEENQKAINEAPAPVPFISTKPRIVEPVEIELDRKRHLKLPFWALKRFEQLTGVSPWDHGKVWGYPPSIDLTVAMIWAGLLWEDPELTLEQVEMMPNMEFGNIHYLRFCLDECWGRNNPDAEAPADARQNGTANPNPRQLQPSSTG